MKDIIIAGAGGFAKQLVETLGLLFPNSSISCFDDYNKDHNLFLERFTVHHTLKDLNPNQYHFVLGTGNPELRRKFYDLFITSGFSPLAVIDPSCRISNIRTHLKEASIVLANGILEPDVSVGLGALINLNCTLTHDVVIGNFTEISPGCLILGGAIIGNNCFVGAGSIVLPNIIIEDDCIIGAGSVVTKNMSKGTKAYGVPAKKLNIEK